MFIIPMSPFQVIKCPPPPGKLFSSFCYALEAVYVNMVNRQHSYMPKMTKTIQLMVLEYLQTQSKASASRCFSASLPWIGYLLLWMHQGLSPPWFTTPRGISAMWHEIEASVQISHPLWVVIKCPAPGKIKFIKFLPGSKRHQMPGVCPGGGGGMFKLQFDWYITLVDHEITLCLLFPLWLFVLCEIETKLNEVCTLWNKIRTSQNEKSVICKIKSVPVLCEMQIISTLLNEICSLPNENLYFAKWHKDPSPR